MPFKFESISNKKMGIYAVLSIAMGMSIEAITGDHDNILADGLTFLGLILLVMSYYGLENLGFIDDIIDKYQKYYKESYHHNSETEEDSDYKYYDESVIVNEKFQRYLHFMGLSSNVNKNNIKKQYRKMARQYHPDHFANKSQSEIKKATLNMQQLNEAYEYLMKNFEYIEG